MNDIDGAQTPRYVPVQPEDTGDAGSELPTAEYAGDSSRVIQCGLELWNRQMDYYTGPDALLDFNPIDYVHIDITDSNPSGLAQLLMGRKTRLSTILNDRAKNEAGMRAARALRNKIVELENQHGLSAGYFAAGTASWLSRDVRQPAAGSAAEKRFIAPILLAPVTILPHPGGKDYEVRLVGDAKLNPAMVRQIHREFDIDLGSLDVASLTRSMAKLDPEPVIDRLRVTAGKIPGMVVEAKYFISTFADLKESPASLPEESYTPLVRRLARMADPENEPVFPDAHVENSAVPVDERAPEDEVLIFDADSAAQEVIDLAEAGHSLVVTAASGTCPLRTATNIASSLINRGKSVLVVGEKSSTLADFNRLLADKQLTGITFSLLEDHSAEEMREKFIGAIVRNEGAGEPNLRPVYRELVEVRRQLAAHTSSLKHTESRWGCSIYDALENLAALTAGNPAPATEVRLSPSVADSLSDRVRVAAQLRQLAQLGAFSPATEFSPWRGARLVNGEEAETAYRLVVSLIDRFEQMHASLQTVAEQLGMRLGRNLTDWRAQLNLLERMRGTLTKFREGIYDRPVDDLIAATASGSWRREHGVEMSSIRRSRLRKAAKEYILPGVHLGDLHQNLLVVQAERDEWLDWSYRSHRPHIPENLDFLSGQLHDLIQECDGLALVLEDSADGNDFTGADFRQVLQRLYALRDDRRQLETLPERDRIEEDMRRLGLGEFMADMLSRRVSAEEVGAELELAWWQSVLEMMLESDEVDILDGDTLRDCEARFRRIDSAHMDSAPARLIASVADTWRRRIEQYPEEAAYLKSQLRGHSFRCDQLLDRAPRMATTLYPLWVSSPFALTRHLAPSTRFDTVILLDSESTPLAANLPAITRADQVVALGDPHSGFPAPFAVSALATAAPQETVQRIESTHSALAKILPTRFLSRIIDRAIDPVILSYLNKNFYRQQLRHHPWAEEIAADIPSFIVEYVDTVGRVSDNANLDSPGVEVTRVAQRVLEHAYKNPHQSLAVVTASQRHARRIADEIGALLPQYRQLADFFRSDRPEPFTVVDLSRAGGLERDTVIFSLGAGKSRQGTVNHTLGQLSQVHGREYFVLGMTRARHLTRFVSCLEYGDLDPHLLDYGAADLYRVLAEYENCRQSPLRETDAETGTEGWLLSDIVRRLSGQGVQLLAGSGPVSLLALSSRESLMAGSTLSPRLRRMGTAADQLSFNFPLATCSDGSDDYASLSVRERSRLIPDALERTGWNYMTLWSTEMFSDPQSVAERVCRYLGVAAEDNR